MFSEIKDVKTATKFFQKFLKKYCYDSLEVLKKFDFRNILNDKEYGYASHCDDTKIMKVIYYLIWNKTLPELEINQIGGGKKYRGDTINTFNTLFSENLSRAKQYSNNNSLFLEKVINFKSIYLTLGNFSVLPNIACGKNSRGWNNTINLQRGDWNLYGDFYDLFLVALKQCYNGNCSDKKMQSIFNTNTFYFSNITFSAFIKINYFEDYINGKDIISFGKTKDKFWKGISSPQEYIDFSTNYINIAEKIINNRAEKMIEKLSKF